MEPLENNTTTENEASFRSQWEGLKTRALSSAILIAVAMGTLWQGGWMFMLLIVLAALIMFKEWTALTERENPMWRVCGLFYVAIPCASLIWLRGLRLEEAPDAGLKLVLYLFFVVWATDIGAYFAGRQIGGPKLAPVISPGKTWAGLGGGVVCAGLVGGLCHLFSPFPITLAASIFLGGLLAVLAQAGDLFESWIKRRADVKDSGKLIPGHGGLLDRVDGLTLTAPLFAWSVYLSMNPL